MVHSSKHPLPQGLEPAWAGFLAVVLLIISTKALAQQGKTPPRDPALIAVPANLPDQDSADDRPCFTLDGKTMYFGSRRPSRDAWRVRNSNPQWKWDSDLWYRILTDTGWSIPINVGPPVNNSAEQANPTISPRGDELYYMSNGTMMQAHLLPNGKFAAPKPVTGLFSRIYQARSRAQAFYLDSIRMLAYKEMLPDSDLRKRAPDAWQLHYNEKMVRLVKTVAAWDFATMFRGETTLTPDGKTVVFSENFGKKGEYGLGGLGADDLWIVPVKKDGEWDSVLAPNGAVNSEYDDTYPFIAADGSTLYFTSDRPCPSCAPGTWGRQDLYKTVFNGTKWTDPIPLGPPFNTEADDYGFSIGPDGQTAYFVSNRTGPSRLYEVKLSARDSDLAPMPVVVLRGHVTDAKTHKPLGAEIFIDDLTSDANRTSVYSDSATGEYILAAPRGHRFGIQAVARGYLPLSERFTVPAVGTFDQTQLELALSPEEVGAHVELKNVYFDFGKTTLRPESRLELNRIVLFLKGSPKVSIEIDGHTDDVGSDAYNNGLSNARAVAVLNYLVQQGIDQSRLIAKGLGKTHPLVVGTSDAARAANRRVEFVITSDGSVPSMNTQPEHPAGK